MKFPQQVGSGLGLVCWKPGVSLSPYSALPVPVVSKLTPELLDRQFYIRQCQTVQNYSRFYLIHWQQTG